MNPEASIHTEQSSPADSLIACLSILCRIHGIAITRDALTAGLPLSDGYMTPALIKRAAERANLVSNVIKKPLQGDRQAVPALHPVAAAA